MATLIETDADKLIRYRNWESELVTALEHPETVSAFGGMPDATGNPVGIQRMAGRAELLAELQWLRGEITKLESQLSGAFEVTSQMSS